ncbi:DUF222 domain-containing protein [Microbispora sp. NPDC046973]|uniref:HNH endonuclease signature motif containing protein n=1 Tax=Microbispora sp. NPDC046973 TaxID=3155022 RepID=UPI0033FBEF02
MDAAGAGDRRVRSSWVLVGGLRESAQELALAPLPEDVDVCLAEAEELMFVRDRITCALAGRVGRVHGAGRAKEHGHASTRSWLRTAGGMTVAGAGRLLTLGVELARLPRVRERFAAGGLAAGVVEAICMAAAQLSDEQAALAEPILLELAGKAGAAEVAKAGRYLRAVLDPDGEDRDEQADYARRFLRVRPTRGGGLEGEFCLPREAAARLRALLDAYAKPRAEGDDRPPSVRNADAFIALLEEKIATELLVLVTAESLPTDPQPTDHQPTDHPEAAPPAAGTDPAADRFEAAVRGEAGSADAPGEAENTGDRASRDAGGVDGVAGTDAAESAASAEGDDGAEGDDTGHAKGGDCDRAAAHPGATHPSPAAWPAWGGSAPPPTAPPSAAQPDPPPEDASAHHAHAGHRPAGECRHGQGTLEDHADVHCEQCQEPGGDQQGRAQQDAADGQGACEGGGGARWWGRMPETPPRPTPGVPRRPSGTASGALGSERGVPRSERGTPPTTTQGRPSGMAPGRAQGASPGVLPGASPGVLPGASPGVSLGTAPGLLLATGQTLPVTSVHRLARTSTLVRLVMDAGGQVLDMGRKVRLATPAQRRAVFARYATCWIDGCPLPATMCQIDHADNWSTGGLTDLKLLGPACQFHNRDRYRHPDRYTRRKVGTDRWAFTYHPAHTRARSPRHEPGT